ncbi:MAG TPA: hypothetical protein VFQ35_15215 [Polyangiaceae bacterium]|nr:hypothetical protein [Polyangiaceae bacterium]
MQKRGATFGVALCGLVVGCGSADGDPQPDDRAKQFEFNELVRPAPCFVRELPVAGDGAACVLTKTKLLGQTSCDCEKVGLGVAPPELASATKQTLRRESLCDAPGGLACESLCVCVVPQLHDELGERCRNDPNAEDIAGWCYVAPAQGLGNASQLETCSADNARELRLFGVTPSENTILTLSCYAP